VYVFLGAFLCFNIAQHASVSCALTSELQTKIAKANEEGPYLGLIIPNSFELDPLLQNPGYTPSDTIIDFAGICIHNIPTKYYHNFLGSQSHL